MKCVLALDQGTTSSKAFLFDEAGTLRASAGREFKQYFPQPGWVEHDPNEIWKTQETAAHAAMHHAGVHCEEIAAIGIANQRETTVLWNRKTGAPIHRAIAWHDRRTAAACARLRADGSETLLRAKTGLLADPYFSATKIQWLLDHIEGARAQAERGELAFGTIDSWLVWKLTHGERHITDISNASRTLLFNIHTRRWDDELLALFNIPHALLPEVRASADLHGTVNKYLCVPECRIAGLAGDQQAALFGQACFARGAAKNTYGTGCFLLANTGDQPIESTHHLLTTIAWQRGNELRYALEGSVFVAGAAVQWLRDELGIIRSAAEIEPLAAQVPDTGGIVFVPAFAGLGAPHWDPLARGSVVGLTRGSSRAHLARATLEAICFQSIDLLRAMECDNGIPIAPLRVDGGACTNNLLMQMQADLLQAPVFRPKQIETTAFGAAALAGLTVGFWKNETEIAACGGIDRLFEPRISADEAAARYARWGAAVAHCRAWHNKLPASQSQEERTVARSASDHAANG